MADDPHHDVTAIICTRDRPDQLENAVRAVLNSDYRHFDLFVVDQSTNDASFLLLSRMAEHDQRLSFTRDTGMGLSRARNIGLAATRSKYVIFTDDDCEPATNWLRLLREALVEPDVGIAFGSVVPVECDPALGFIVGYLPPRRQRMAGRLAKLRDGGIGANMGFRRSALVKTGGFDEMLGAGGYFPSCEDGDMTYRILRSGYMLAHVPEARVDHFGFRDWKSGSRLTRQTYVAVAAAFTKYVRLRDPVAVLLLGHALALSMIEIAASVRNKRRPVGFGRMAALLVGVCRSFELPLDKTRSIYLSKV